MFSAEFACEMLKGQWRWKWGKMDQLQVHVCAMETWDLLHYDAHIVYKHTSAHWLLVSIMHYTFENA